VHFTFLEHASYFPGLAALSDSRSSRDEGISSTDCLLTESDGFSFLDAGVVSIHFAVTGVILIPMVDLDAGIIVLVVVWH